MRPLVVKTLAAVARATCVCIAGAPLNDYDEVFERLDVLRDFARDMALGGAPIDVDAVPEYLIRATASYDETVERNVREEEKAGAWNILACTAVALKDKLEADLRQGRSKPYNMPQAKGVQ